MSVDGGCGGGVPDERKRAEGEKYEPLNRVLAPLCAAETRHPDHAGRAGHDTLGLTGWRAGMETVLA